MADLTAENTDVYIYAHTHLGFELGAFAFLDGVGYRSITKPRELLLHHIHKLESVCEPKEKERERERERVWRGCEDQLQNALTPPSSSP
jgi:hypothetical protein